MQNMKMGYIVQILKQDNLGVIREESTLTEYLFYLDEAPEALRVNDAVAFTRDTDHEQFVAEDVKRVDGIRSRWAV